MFSVTRYFNLSDENFPKYGRLAFIWHMVTENKLEKGVLNVITLTADVSHPVRT